MYAIHTLVVFNIGGSKYRLIAAVHYNRGKVYIRHVLTHTEYDRLEFLMEQQGLKQEDLADCAPQSCISEILNGKRTISKEIAKCLAKRFKVSVDLFI
jgi:hypothetical protein